MRSSDLSCLGARKTLGIVCLALALAVLGGVESATAIDDSTDSGLTAAEQKIDASGATKTESAAPTSGGRAGVTPGKARGKAPVYAPPRRGRPRARVGGGVRGAGPKLPTIRALVPAHVAHTARSQPTLLWFVSEVPPTETSLMFSLTTDEEIDPLIRAKLDTPTQPGVQRIDLANYEFSLETGKEYEWSVALVADSESRARDLVTLGWIERVENGDGNDTSEKVAQGWIERVDDPEAEAIASSTPNASALAAAGLWYDAVDVADQNERAALLDQIGLESSGLR